MSVTEKGAKSKREAKEEKVKDQKLEEQILNEISSAGTIEEQFTLLLGRHVESERASRRLKQDMKAQEKRLEVFLREKENLQREYNKSVLMRDKLQEVCREQQKIIKSIKNENLTKLREEEERRKDNQTKFQASINEINQSLSKNSEENLKLRDHNTEMTQKLKYLAEQYQVREKQLEKLNEQIQLESQLQQAKLHKVEVQAAMEKEMLLKEKQNAIERLSHTQTVLKELTDREQALKEQLGWYTSKYDDFQNSLQKSNDIFATYKIELEKLSKNTKKIEKESLEWKRKWEKSNATLIELATEKKDRDDHAARCTKQVDQLQKLLRALQHERTHLYKILRDNNIDCPALPELPPEPELLKIIPETKEKEDKDKMEMMTKKCAEIKQTLASLQSKINSIKLEETEANAVVNTKQKQQQEEALKKQQKKKKQKPKNKSNFTPGAFIVSSTSNAQNEESSCITPEKGIKVEVNEFTGANMAILPPVVTTEESMANAYCADNVEIVKEVNTINDVHSELNELDSTSDIHNEIVEIATNATQAVSISVLPANEPTDVPN